MGSKSTIQWTDASWTPIRARVKEDAAAIATAKGYTSLVQIATDMAGHVGPHCEHVSDGCTKCYSETGNGRCLTHNGTGLPFDRRARDLVDIIVDEKILEWPLHWKKPRKVFVCSQTDLFGEWVTDEMIDRVFAVMALCPQHTFQVLTKRPDRMLKWFGATKPHGNFLPMTTPQRVDSAAGEFTGCQDDLIVKAWPLPNVWLGVSCEDQPTADVRAHYLRQVPAAIRFISQEPQLSKIDWTGDMLHGISWLIVGGESGPGARPFDIEWASKTIEQCKAAGVAVFVKQIGAKPFHSLDKEYPRVPLEDRKGGDMGEWPVRLRVRQFPEVRA